MERNRLDRIRQSVSLVIKLKPLREQLALVADAPLLPESFAADRREAETNLRNATYALKQALQEIERLEEALSRVRVPVELLAHQTAISGLQAALGSYQKAAKDRPGLLAKCELAQQHAQELLQHSGRSLTLDDAETLGLNQSLRLNKVQRKRIHDLAVECNALLERQQASDRTVRQLGQQIERVEQQLAPLPPARDVAELQRVIRQVQKEGDLDARLKAAQDKLDACREQAGVELARLPRFDGSLPALERLPIPSLETIDRFEADLANVDTRVKRCDERIEQWQADVARLETNLETLRLQGELPTEADLEDARRRRDEGWGLIQAVMNNAEHVSSRLIADFVEQYPTSDDLSAAFRQSISQTDTIADRLRREADRVAQQAKYLADLQQSTSNLTLARTERQQVEQERARIERDWQAQWKEAAIVPGTPREMRSWRVPQQKLVAIAADVRLLETEIQRHQDQLDTCRMQLHQCLDFLGHARLADSKPLASVLECCQELAEQIRGNNQLREQLVRDLEHLGAQRTEAEHEAEDARRTLLEWRVKWADAVAMLGLERDATPAEANELISTVDELVAAWDELRDLRQRIDGIDADAQAFFESVRQLLQHVAPDLCETMRISVERAVADLVDRLNQAGKDEARVEGWTAQLQRERAAHDNAQLQIAHWQGQLDSLCQQAGCQLSEELPHTEERSKARREAEAEWKGVKHRLRELAGGTSLDEWIDTVELSDADRCQAELAKLDETIEMLEREKMSVSEQIGEQRNELARMDGSGRAADSMIEAEHWLASIRNDAEEFIRRRLASVVLTRAMERFREASQGPVISRAADLFSRLTCGSFAGLRPDDDRHGNMVLKGVRPDGRTVEVAGMSDGTCDQLYLALRLAFLESSLAGHEPLPFLVDDILITFDDERAAAALQTLLQLTEKTQVVFFTHHEHLVELAQATLAPEQLCIQRLA
jgi:uncharacterized protein YhaN